MEKEYNYFTGFPSLKLMEWEGKYIGMWGFEFDPSVFTRTEAFEVLVKARQAKPTEICPPEQAALLSEFKKDMENLFEQNWPETNGFLGASMFGL